MALPQVSQLQSANKYKKYEAYFDSLGQATRLYMDNNAKDLFGNNTSGCVRVKYSELKAQGLVKDYGSADVDCGTEDTYVEVRKVNNIYKYAVSVVCKSQKNKNDIVWQQQDAMEGASCEFKPDTDAPIIEITPKSSDWKTSKQLTVHIKVSDVSGLNKNIRIQYYWLDQSGNKVGKTYKYNYNNKAGKEKVSYKIPVKNIPEKSGKYYLVVEPDTSSTSSGVMDALGNTKYTSEKAGIYKIDNTPPTCGSVSGAKTTWTNKNFSITQQCIDHESSCEKTSYSQKFTSTTKTYTFTIKDKVGNTTKCPVNVYLDKDKPTCGTVSGQSTSWTKNNRSISVKCNDKSNGSGCVKTSYKQTFSSTAKQSSITIADVAGNTNSCKVNVYVDKTAPTCGSISGQSTSWTKGNRSITVKCNDSNSGCSKSSFSKTFNSDTRVGTVTISDKVGNTKNCSANVYVDKTAPSCGSVSGQSTTWTNQNRTISVQCSDGASGCSKGSFSKTFTSEGKQDSIAISDSAGNSRSCTVNKYIDKTPPSISATWRREDNGATYSSGSLSDVSLIRKVNYSDNLSGVRTVEYNTGGGWATEGNLGDYKYASDTVNEYITFRAIDYAGNIGQTSQYHIRIEKDVDKDYHISCSITCHGACGLQKPGGGIYWNDSIYKWNLNGAKSGINRNTMGIDYSTDWVHNYCLYTPSNAPSGSRAGCGYAIFNSTTIDYSRSYACSSIIGRACTNRGKCAQCAITDRIGC